MEQAPQPKQAKASPLAIAAIICGLLGIVVPWILIGIWSITIKKQEYLGYLAAENQIYTLAAFMVIMFVLTLVLGIAAKVISHCRRNGGFDGKLIGNILFFMPLVMIGAAIIVPNFMGSSIMMSTMRTHYYLKQTANAVNTYYVDHHSWPAWTADSAVSTKPRSPGISTFYESSEMATRLHTLTTPDPYLNAHIYDYYYDHIEMFGYQTVGEGREAAWILFSSGPDIDYDLKPDVIRQVFHPADSQPSPGLLALTYNPTNGSTSNGDIWRTSRGITSPGLKSGDFH